MTDSKDKRAAVAASVTVGLCICEHHKEAHTHFDHTMERIFPGQKWDGCTKCGCPFFRQEDEISVGLRTGSLRVVSHEEVIRMEIERWKKITRMVADQRDTARRTALLEAAAAIDAGRKAMTWWFRLLGAEWFCRRLAADIREIAEDAPKAPEKIP